MPVVDGQGEYNKLKKSGTRKHSERDPTKTCIRSSDVRWECLLADGTELEGIHYDETNEHHNADNAVNGSESVTDPPIRVPQRDGPDQEQSCGIVVRTEP